MSNSSKQSSPHASAAGAYDNNARKHTPDQRELEGRVLLKGAQNFVDIQTQWDNLQPTELNAELNKALIYNRQIWMLFVDNAALDENAERPRSLRSNIASLGSFIFSHMIEVQAVPARAKLDVLININREIAAGLMVRQAMAPQLSEAPQATGTMQSA